VPTSIKLLPKIHSHWSQKGFVSVVWDFIW
jgi:hypothetical protein